MADVDIVYGCGCGFKTGRLEAAVEHSDNTRHSMTVLGTIKYVENPQVMRINSPKLTQTTKTEIPADASRIEELRRKFSNGG